MELHKKIIAARNESIPFLELCDDITGFLREASRTLSSDHGNDFVAISEIYYDKLTRAHNAVYKGEISGLEAARGLLNNTNDFSNAKIIELSEGYSPTVKDRAIAAFSAVKPKIDDMIVGFIERTESVKLGELKSRLIGFSR